MIRVSCFLLRTLNRIVARLRGSVGWCAMAYTIGRNGIPESAPDEDGWIWEGTESEGILRSWRGAFMFEYKPLT